MTVELMSRNLRVEVRPDLGGRVDQICDLRTGRDWLWHPRSYTRDFTRSLAAGASFDDNWTGGWDEMFPNDAAGDFRGRKLVDHGELWSRAWNVVEKSTCGIKMALICETVPVAVEKTIYLHEDSPGLSVQYLLKNQSDEAVPFHLKMHPAIAIEEGDQLLMPECEIEPVELDFSRIIGRKAVTRYPHAFAADGSEVRVDQMMEGSTGAREFMYASSLERGECGIRNARTGSVMRLAFDKEQFPYVWIFQSFGGFNGHYVMMLEPCTTKHYDLATSIAQGQAPRLRANEIRELRIDVRFERE